MMKKILGVLAIASFSAVPLAQADVAGFEIGTYQWTPDYKGTIRADDNLTQGDDINLQDDLGFTDDTHNVIWASLEHPIPLLPNIKITSSNLDTSATNTLTRTVEFGGETFSQSEEVTTIIDSSNTEYTLYYEVLDNWVNLDLGATFREYDGVVSLNTPESGSNISEVEPLDFTIPLFYAKGRFDLPFTGFFVDAQMNYIGYDDDSVSDLMVALGYESEIGFGASLGYRTFDLEAEEDDLSVDLQFDGAYFSAFYHF